MYNFQLNNEQIGIKLMDNMVEKSYWNTAISCSKLICKDFTDLGLFLILVIKITVMKQQ